MERKAALIADSWPQSFSIFIERNWNMNFDDKPVKLKVSYLDAGLSEKQRNDFKTFIFNRRTTFMHKWLIEIIQRLFAGKISKEWIEKQDFIIDLKFICGIQVDLVFNFPCETETLPTDLYPLAFVLNRA